MPHRGWGTTNPAQRARHRRSPLTLSLACSLGKCACLHCDGHTAQGPCQHRCHRSEAFTWRECAACDGTGSVYLDTSGQLHHRKIPGGRCPCPCHRSDRWSLPDRLARPSAASLEDAMTLAHPPVTETEQTALDAAAHKANKRGHAMSIDPELTVFPGCDKIRLRCDHGHCQATISIAHDGRLLDGAQSSCAWEAG